MAVRTPTEQKRAPVNSDRRAFITRAATLGAFAVPFVTSFGAQGGFKFGNPASAYGG